MSRSHFLNLANVSVTAFTLLAKTARSRFGQADAVHAARQDTLDRAFRENRARFVN